MMRDRWPRHGQQLRELADGARPLAEQGQDRAALRVAERLERVRSGAGRSPSRPRHVPSGR